MLNFNGHWFFVIDYEHKELESYAKLNFTLQEVEVEPLFSKLELKPKDLKQLEWNLSYLTKISQKSSKDRITNIFKLACKFIKEYQSKD